MASLAQRIFDTSHNERVSNRAQYEHDVRSVFAKNVSRGIDNGKSLQIAALLKPMMASMPSLAKELSFAMKFTVDTNVANAVEKMFKTPEEKILLALPFAQLPNDKVWIEYTTDSHDLKVGWLIEKYEDGLSVKAVISTSTMNHVPIFNNGTSHFFVNAKGFHAHPDSGEHNKLTSSFSETNAKNAVSQCKHAIILLILLNSRSNILKVTPHGRNDEKRVNNRLLSRGKPEKAFLNKIRFDVARIIGKDKSLSREQAAQNIATSLVMGHFKIRKTGIFFWSPHVRGAKTEEEKAEAEKCGLDRERHIVKSRRPSSMPHFTK